MATNHTTESDPRDTEREEAAAAMRADRHMTDAERDAANKAFDADVAEREGSA